MEYYMNGLEIDKMKSDNQKKLYIEVLRILAILMVLYVHSGTRAAHYYVVESSGISYYVSIILACVTKTCNMLFFMISGALLLHKEESLRTIFVHRVLRMVLIILIFGLLQYYLNYKANPAIGFSMDVYFKIVYSTNIIEQYWFLHAYLAFLLLLPFIRFIARSMKKEHFLYLGGLFLLVEGILPMIERIWDNQRIALDISLFAVEILLPLMGFYLTKVYDFEGLEKRKKVRDLAAVNIMGVAALFLCVRETKILLETTNTLVVYNGLLFIMAITIFFDIRYIFTRFKVPDILSKIIVFMGGGVFGVYLMEMELRTDFAFIYDAIQPRTNWLVATVIWLSVCVLVGSTVTGIVKKIPIVGKLF